MSVGIDKFLFVNNMHLLIRSSVFKPFQKWREMLVNRRKSCIFALVYSANAIIWSVAHFQTLYTPC